VSGLIVADVGNSRIKWGRCELGGIADVAVLPPDAPDAWQRQLEIWTVEPAATWIVSGVHPQRRDALVEWLRRTAADVQVVDSYQQLPLVVQVDEPGQVGIDRLLNAVAANRRRPPGLAAVVIDAGSAVTVDLVDATGAFCGGAIFPGLRLMAQALHEHTALLPLVAVDRGVPPPGTSTAQAIRAGVFHAVLGGIQLLLTKYRTRCAGGMDVYITGGDAALLTADRRTLGEHWPEMTLEGVLHSSPKAASHG
jgi:type III pantothenate kinase